MKKRAGKKKATKKGAKKKAAKKKKAKKGKRHAVSIRNSRVSRKRVKLKKNRSSRSPDSIRWTSKDGDYRLSFKSTWPFVSAPDVAPRTILVSAGRKSRVFKIDKNAANKTYAYFVKPAAKGKKPTPVVVASE